MNKDLFGNEIIEDVLLRDKFIEPPFTRLDSIGGHWQNRKTMWKAKGLKSEVGRQSELCLAQGLNKFDPRESYTGTSIFDPVLCELMYHWFCKENGNILDPFAGGSVRGIIANYLGYKYTGIELRPEQVESNREQAKEILSIDNQPVWITGDSEKELDNINEKFDFIFSCPPYFNLEIYSELETDLSNMTYDNFLKKYSSIIKKSLEKLKNNCYACFVVGEVRNKNGYYIGFVPDTINIFRSVGMEYYNEAIFLENGLNTAAMRADKQFTAGKKLVKIHQNVLIFKKL